MSKNETHHDDVKVEEVTLDDGRRAEKHITKDSSKEVVEVFAEQKPVMKLENRIIRETKTIVVKEIHQKLEDNNVVSEEVFEVSPEAFSLTKNISTQSVKPNVKLEEVVEQAVGEKKKNDKIVNFVLIGMIVLQVALLVGYFLF
jgi:hypothetical protein